MANRPRRYSASSTGSGSAILPTSRVDLGLARELSMKSKRSSLHSNLHGSMADKYSLGPSPEEWGISLNSREADDELHDPRYMSGNGRIVTLRALANMGCLILLITGIIALFAGEDSSFCRRDRPGLIKQNNIPPGYPIATHYIRKAQSFQGGFNLGGINATGQIPALITNSGLIDADTPQSAYTKASYSDPSQQMVLVFSDEFNQDGRTFYPGDDPYWEAVDLHYWGTVDLEWYDPMQATTSGGYLRLRIDKVDDPTLNHNLEYRSGMIQSWNKFCFTGGMIEAGVMLPGSNNVSGLWPAVWTMGNLGRAGFGGSLDGVWPYTYDSCDVGTLANQTNPQPLDGSDGTITPVAATINGDPQYNGQLSMLPGQKLSACTCPGEAHPGPIRSDGTFVGRSSPEIDVFEAIVNGGVGQASLSAQWAPFDAAYKWNTTGNFVSQNVDTIFNTFVGGAFQQTTSGLATTSQKCYELNEACFSVFGFEYKPGFDDGYITWVSDGQLSWTLHGKGLGKDAATEISERPVSGEPMYIIANLGLSLGFGTVDFDNLVFPATMSIDYIRVYQPADSMNVGCDPKDYPTAKYIETFPEAYTNANLTVWSDVGQPWPKNRLIDTC